MINSAPAPLAGVFCCGIWRRLTNAASNEKGRLSWRPRFKKPCYLDCAAGPGSPFGPAGPAEPLGPGGPAGPGGPGGPGGPATPGGPCCPAGPWAPVSPFGPGGPAGPSKQPASAKQAASAIAVAIRICLASIPVARSVRRGALRQTQSDRLTAGRSLLRAAESKQCTYREIAHTTHRTHVERRRTELQSLRLSWLAPQSPRTSKQIPLEKSTRSHSVASFQGALGSSQCFMRPRRDRRRLKGG
jgi:hypothetical protein